MSASKSQKSERGSRNYNNDSRSKVDGKLLDALKHYDSFYEKPPPGLLKNPDEDEERPEDCIPDTPQNRDAREFLSKAPSKGLWMPLGKEVKVMKCWRCKNYGHRTGDKECPMFMSGNRDAEEFRHSHEDPMYNYVKESEIEQKMLKVQMLKQLLNTSSSKSKKKKSKKTKHKDENKKLKNKYKETKPKKNKRETSSDSDSSDSDSSSSTSSSSSSSSLTGTSDDSGDSFYNKKRKRHSSSKTKHKHHKTPSKKSKHKRSRK